VKNEEYRMTELKIEAGKLYFDKKNRWKLIYIGFFNELYKFFNYNTGALHNYDDKYLEDLETYQDEPQAGWVYEDEFGNTIKIIANINEHIDERLSRLAINFIGINIKSGNVIKYDKDGLAQFNNHNLKLETGRPADE
jgi:hypothetical protein